MALNPGVPPAPERPAGELYEWVRREEQYATLATNVVVELYGESHARRPTTRAWAIIRRAYRIHRRSANAQTAPSAATPIALTVQGGLGNPRRRRWRPDAR